MSMNRRGVIEAIGVGGLTVLAGCSSNSSNEQSEQVGKEPDEETPDEEAEFEFVEWNVPSECVCSKRMCDGWFRKRYLLLTQQVKL
jgi:hypothetical protein